MITVNNIEQLWHEGLTITLLIENALKKDPHFDPNTVVIILNNKNIPRSEFDKTTVNDNDNIFFIVPLSGG